MSQPKDKYEVVLVDENDLPMGVMEKLEAHRKGLLHRAFSVFVFNDKGQLLLQRRALGKYHSGGLWTNSCCSHPGPGEDVREAAERRLKEEMGFSVPLKFFKSFTYKADLENGLIEHEFDHVFIGHYSDAPTPDPAEVAEWKYVAMDDLVSDMQATPSSYTVWLTIIMPELLDHIGS
jgi:isopentenyl-diphosphate Delta-isomerase